MTLRYHYSVLLSTEGNEDEGRGMKGTGRETGILELVVLEFSEREHVFFFFSNLFLCMSSVLSERFLEFSPFLRLIFLPLLFSSLLLLAIARVHSQPPLSTSRLGGGISGGSAWGHPDVADRRDHG